MIKESELNKLKNDIIEKEAQIHRCRENQNTLSGYKSFIEQIFLYSSQKPKLDQLQDPHRRFFLTEHGADPFENMDTSHRPKQFVSLLNKIEDDNLMLIKTLQNQQHEIQKLQRNMSK